MPNLLGGQGADGVRVDVSDLAYLDSKLKRFEPALRRAMRRRIRNAGRRVAQKIQAAAVAVGSESIPAAIVLQNAFTPKRAGVYIRVSKPKLPEGHKAVGHMVEGRRDGRGHRRPVYGRKDIPWVEQTPTPYFTRTALAEQAAVAGEVAAAMDEAGRAAGFR